MTLDPGRIEARRARLAERLARRARHRARVGATAAGIAGAALLSAGAWWIHRPAGVLVLGFLLLALAVEELRS